MLGARSSEAHQRERCKTAKMEESTVLFPAALWPAGRQKDGPVWPLPGVGMTSPGEAEERRLKLWT